MRNLIENYIPFSKQEEKDKKAILQFMNHNNDYLLQSNLVALMSSSAIVVNEEMKKVLFAYHNIYNSWGWVDGHNDGDDDPLNVAMKEVVEETGIKNMKIYSEDIFILDVIYVFNHIKNGVYINDHLYLKAISLMIVDENDKLTIKPDENSGVQWFDIDTVFDHVSEDRIKSVYKKAFNEIKRNNQNLKMISKYL
ncbi:NUDIX domain protein [Candidatus Izimaplasma bacterium HR1]|jgi:8-oxo-dGTP pyrophosphatase MutT (NUDIX family)|uniref:NUDIX hydrolase n=1 Tax=Candidatus Izimoplasma sp. HR1 TaxID=1541959 RepID=UPI0004F74A52|nr:NUDIX domain protein [Candidatus Izimaplasma bacterium HR1]